MKNYQKKALSSILSSALIAAGVSSVLMPNANAQEVYPDGIHFSDDEIYPVERLDDYIIEEEIADQYSNDDKTDNDNVQSDEPLRTSTDLVDTDGDGIPDEWEKHGFINDQGKLFPLDEWGADPYRPDIFLQLNWMHPDPRVGQEDMYAPERSSLDKLVDLFDKNGYNLHIDAGKAYNNIPNSESYGGQTIPFTDMYINDFDNPALILEQQRVDYLKDRSGLFHSGTIVKRVNTNRNGGVGVINGGSFTVQSLSERYLHHIILHELGHNLGLSHHGPVGKTYIGSPLNGEFLPNYRSEMNYIYSYGQFDYTHQSSYSTDKLPVECLYTRLKCYEGKYEVASDWDNLQLKNLFIGRFNGKTAEKTDSVKLVNNTQNKKFNDQNNQYNELTFQEDGNKEKKVSENTREDEKDTLTTTQENHVTNTLTTTQENLSTNTRKDNNKPVSQQGVVGSTTTSFPDKLDSNKVLETEKQEDSSLKNDKKVSTIVSTPKEEPTILKDIEKEDDNQVNDIIINILISLGTALASIGILSWTWYVLSSFM